MGTELQLDQNKLNSKKDTWHQHWGGGGLYKPREG